MKVSRKKSIKINKERSPLIYSNGRAFSLYITALVTLALSIFISYMVFSDLNNFFSEYSSKLSGIFWLTFFLISGNIMLLCMLWLSGKYVLRIEDAEEGLISVKTWSVLGFSKIRKYPKTILENPKYYEGYTKIHRVPTVNTPWLKLKTPKGKYLVVDLQGDFNITIKY